jgi:hypothetical protein
MRKLSTTIVITGVILLQSAFPAFAAQTTSEQKLLNVANRIDKAASNAAGKQTNELQNIINRSNTLITNRLTSLSTLSTRVQGDKRLSTSEKSSLTSDIQTDTTGLTALKTKIDADTDATTARTDEKQIITNFYVYAVFEPKLRYLIILNNLQTTTSNIQAFVPQLQNLITTFKSQGKDVTQLQSLLDDISSQLQTVNTTISADITTVQNISPTAKPTTDQFSKVKQDISQIVRAGLGKIKADFDQMKPLFKQLISQKQATPTPSSAAVSTTPVQVSPTTSVSSSPSTTP